MTADACPPVEVSRRIAAPAGVIFRILTDPKRHLDLDGSGMLRGVESEVILTCVGDVFVMNMYYSALGGYQMNNHVVVYELDKRIGWEPVAGDGHPEAGSRVGHRWSFELTSDGPNATIVTEIYDCSAAPEEFRVAMDNGRNWTESMEGTLERLDVIASGR
jgi:hypothetical protein